MAAARQDASIRVWRRDSESGKVETFDITVAQESRLELGEFNLYIDLGLEQQLHDLRSQQVPDETGGVLLGFYDFNVKAVVVVAALPAPPDSISSPGSFKRGIIGLVEAVNDASKRTAGMVQYIGEWHSHPPRHSSTPSRDDLVQLIHLALGMADDGLPAVQLIVGERDLHVIQVALK
jgi:integrative and conjugative element protein (TIGR02256 family)